jgi:hypothetical protein
MALFQGAAHLDTEERGHRLFRGPSAGVLTPMSLYGMGERPLSGLWWSSDRAWFVASEIDHAWTFVAGAQELIDRLVADERLEAAPTTFDAYSHEALAPS